MNLLEVLFENFWWILILLIFLNGFSRSKKKRQQQQQEQEAQAQQRQQQMEAQEWDEWDDEEDLEDEGPFRGPDSERPYRPESQKPPLDDLPLPEFLKDMLNDQEDKPFRRQQPQPQEGKPVPARPVTPTTHDSNALRPVAQELKKARPTADPVAPTIQFVEEEVSPIIHDAIAGFNRHKMAEAVIMAEIIGKPKALQRK